MKQKWNNLKEARRRRRRREQQLNTWIRTIKSRQFNTLHDGDDDDYDDDDDGDVCMYAVCGFCAAVTAAVDQTKTKEN